jgi:ATP-dependent Lon protease
VNKFAFYIFVLLSFLTFSQEGKSINIKVDSISKIEVKHFSKNLKEKYTDEAFIYNYKFDPNNLSVWEKFKHWITQKFKDWFNIVDEKKASKFTGFFFRTLYVIVFLAVLLFIIKAILNDEGNWVFGRSNKKLDINAKVLKEELLETNFKELIQNALENKDYRLAIRYYYLSVLKALTKKEIIEWDNEKTNYDYLKEIKDNKLREQFEYISYIYDYCWYGEFQLDEKSFLKAEQKFNQLL